MLADPVSPKSPSKGRRVVDAVPALFERTLLKDEMAIQAAMSALEHYLADPANRPSDTVIELASSVHALELALIGEWSLSLNREVMLIITSVQASTKRHSAYSPRQYSINFPIPLTASPRLSSKFC